MKPIIVITPGEPAGIGADLCIQYLQQFDQQHCDFQLLLIADPDLMTSRATQLGLPFQYSLYEAGKAPLDKDSHLVKILPIALTNPSRCGQLDIDNAEYVLKTLTRACQGCLSNEFQAMVTGPVQKSLINDAGFNFSGHTEFLATLCQTEKVVMMLATQGLRVALATTHLPLAEVPSAITKSSLKQVLIILDQGLRNNFNINTPKILVAGLNPHAGEDGHLGNEEIDIIQPVLDDLNQQGFNLIGPLPADSLFTEKYLGDADAVLAMYHDQGLPVLKYKGFGQAVNITLGLPIIRTSVDHGTALDLAGTGKVDTGSLQTAIEYAIEMTKHSSNLPL